MEEKNMQNYINVFKEKKNTEDFDMLVKGAMKCLDKFGEFFEREDIQGMDSCLHFPHYIISGSDVIFWNEPGQLTDTFFSDLKKNGFKRTVVTCRDVITIAENKVHVKYCYYREGVDGKVMSEHDNVWIVTWKDSKWGIQLRSY